MKLSIITLFVTAAGLAGGSSADAHDGILQRSLRVATSSEENLRDDELGASEDFWGPWHSHYAQAQNDPPSYGTSSASGSGVLEPSVGDLPAAAKELLDKVETVATAAMPFNVEAATSHLLLAGIVVGALFVIAIAAVLIGVRRQQMSEPMFGPVELVSDLPEPMTTSAGDDGCDAGSSSNRSEDGDEADTGVTVLFGEEEEEEKQEEKEVVDDLAAA
ncbi:unnamed protein product [Phytophthora fragariaefolia]|uniref:Unnamed protein product n=1 Tax=Phytophthora fragariaefolia TaxID=1490495 RepID=A0A9W6X909_9STRA|nr:unnamed protein product [Phytophthora fragariaefolia]